MNAKWYHLPCTLAGLKWNFRKKNMEGNHIWQESDAETSGVQSEKTVSQCVNKFPARAAAPASVGGHI